MFGFTFGDSEEGRDLVEEKMELERLQNIYRNGFSSSKNSQILSTSSDSVNDNQEELLSETDALLLLKRIKHCEKKIKEALKRAKEAQDNAVNMQKPSWFDRMFNLYGGHIEFIQEVVKQEADTISNVVESVKVVYENQNELAKIVRIVMMSCAYNATNNDFMLKHVRLMLEEASQEQVDQEWYDTFKNIEKQLKRNKSVFTKQEKMEEKLESLCDEVRLIIGDTNGSSRGQVKKRIKIVALD